MIADHGCETALLIVIVASALGLERGQAGFTSHKFLSSLPEPRLAVAVGGDRLVGSASRSSISRCRRAVVGVVRPGNLESGGIPAPAIRSETGFRSIAAAVPRPRTVTVAAGCIGGAFFDTAGAERRRHHRADLLVFLPRPRVARVHRRIATHRRARRHRLTRGIYLAHRHPGRHSGSVGGAGG